jgi:hypothetical protein
MRQSFLAACGSNTRKSGIAGTKIFPVKMAREKKARVSR